MKKALLFILLNVGMKILAQAPAGSDIAFDCAKTTGRINALNGINNGTKNIATGIIVTDMMNQYYRDMKIPCTRLHDCHWPYSDVVDVPAIFPLFHLDADDPANYNFAKTDDYILELLKSGTQISYRLGVSIEHTKIKYHTHPPKDFDKWAKICVNIIRHYNDGWANGYHLNIKYWEIWNEPEIPQMWSGTLDDYCLLYKTAVTAIKKYNPAVLVGPAGLADPVYFGSADKVLSFCRKENLPIDFFPWHVYSKTPQKVFDYANDVRKRLDKYGFTKTESHCNEWNYWPGEFGRFVYDRYFMKEIYPEQRGIKGAAFVASTLIGLQDIKIDQAFLYGGYCGAFGIFDEYGIPGKQFYAMKAFAMLLDAPVRISCVKDSTYSDIDVLAGINETKDRVVILISNFERKTSEIGYTVSNVPWHASTMIETYSIDYENNLSLTKTTTAEGATIPIRVVASYPSVTVLVLTPQKVINNK